MNYGIVFLALLAGLSAPTAAVLGADKEAAAGAATMSEDFVLDAAEPDAVEWPTGPGAGDPDPWQAFNRKIFAFNEITDRWVLKPVARGYRRITPDPVEAGIANVFSNFGEINVLLNNLLQAKFADAATDTGRLVVNTTVGVAGVFDVATRLGLNKNNEDFGQTMGYWGVESGPYLVLPFLGPRTVRDGFGSIPDSYANPVTYVDPDTTRAAVVALGLVSTRARLLDAERLVRGDRYIFLRDAYLQRRQFLVNDGAVEDSFGTQEFDDDYADW